MPLPYDVNYLPDTCRVVFSRIDSSANAANEGSSEKRRWTSATGPFLRWIVGKVLRTINCEHGESCITSATSIFFQMSEGDGPVVTQVHHFDTDGVENVDWDWSDIQKEIPVVGRDVMRPLFAFSEGKAEGDGWVGLEDVARYAQMIDVFLEG